MYTATPVFESVLVVCTYKAICDSDGRLISCFCVESAIPIYPTHYHSTGPPPYTRQLCHEYGDGTAQGEVAYVRLRRLIVSTSF